MSNNKYYTPDISEFFVGFVYEWQRKDETKFEKAVIKNGSQIDDIHDPVYAIRVKYLDQEDIESLGFKFYLDHVLNAVKNTVYFKLGSNLLAMETHSNKVFIQKYDVELPRAIDELLKIPYESISITFDGRLKNKSELKKLLKQLGIYEGE